jgi:DNA-binding Lrp family transcriptional regulator
MKINKNRMLEILDKNCKATLKEIASELNISKQAVHAKLREMEKDEISSYLTIINYYDLGYNNIHLYLKIHGFEESKFKNKLKTLSQIKSIKWLADFLGEFDLGMSIFFKSVNDLEQTFKEIYKILGKNIKGKEMYIISKQLIPHLSAEHTGRSFFELRKHKEDEIKITPIDKEILEAIVSNSRFSYLDLSESLGISRQSLKEKIKRLEQNKVILGYKPLLNYSALGCYWNLCILKLSPACDSSKLSDCLLEKPSVPFISITADNNIIFDFKGESYTHFKDFVRGIKLKYDILIEDYMLLNLNKVYKLKSI